MAEHRVRRTLAADHPCLAGHFPGQPVVPAVLLLEWVAEAVLAQLRESDKDYVMEGIPEAKFLRPLMPEQPADIFWQETAEAIVFRCEREGSLIARGRLKLVPAR